MKSYRRLLRLPWRTPRSRQGETDEEIEAHLQLRVDDLVAAGMSEDEARAEALARFGDLDGARRAIADEARRRDRKLGWLERVEGLRRDVVVALRRIRGRPGHSLLATVIFGVGIGLTTVMFTFVDNVLLRPLPFPEPDRLVALYSVQESGNAFPWVSMGNWYDWNEQNRTLVSSAIYRQEAQEVTVGSEEGAFTAPGVDVYGAFFETLRMPMAAGRAPSAEEVLSGPPMVVVSETFWRAELGGRALSAGLDLELNGQTRDVVGVVADAYRHPEDVDMWLPGTPRPWTGTMRNNINFRSVARLRPDASLEQAEADLSAIADGIRATDPEGVYSFGVGVRPLDDVVVGGADDYLGVLMGAVVMVLLIACANLAALGYARGTERGEEIAVRLSLGAGRGRIVRQLLTEELLLALAGGLLGLVLAWWGTGAILERIAEVLPRSRDVGFDARIAAFGIGVSVLAGVLAGLPPALRASDGRARQVMAASRAVRGRGGLPGSLLVAGEVALTVLLLTGGGLLLMSFGAVASRDLGYDPSDVVAVDIALTAPHYRGDIDRVVRYWESLEDELRDVPGVQAVGLGNWIPTGDGGAGFIELEGVDDTDLGAGYRLVGGEYFPALGIPTIQGRTFGERDRLDTEPVTVVNQAMADRYWPSTSPIGQRVRAISMEGYWFEDGAPWRTVVGVVGDVRHYGHESDVDEEMFVPYRQMPWITTAMAAVVRLEPGMVGSGLPALRAEARALDPALAVDVSTLETRLHGLLSERRMIVALLSGFALAALGLACLGIYGVISHSVARRTQEMAVRSALGARRGGLVRLVLSGALRLVVIGAVAGVALAAGFRGVLEALLVDVSSADPRAYLLAAATLVVVATAAALVPAWRAARMDPLEALRTS